MVRKQDAKLQETLIMEIMIGFFFVAVAYYLSRETAGDRLENQELARRNHRDRQAFRRLIESL